MQDNLNESEEAKYERKQLIKITQERVITHAQWTQLQKSSDPKVQIAIIEMRNFIVDVYGQDNLKMDILRTTKHKSVLKHFTDRIGNFGPREDRILRCAVLNPISSPTWEGIQDYKGDLLSFSRALVSKLHKNDIQRLYRKNSTKPRDIFVLRTLALSENTPGDLLKVFSASEDATTRACVALNKSTPSEIVEALSRDSVPLIREIVIFGDTFKYDMAIRLITDRNTIYDSFRSFLFEKFWIYDPFCETMMAHGFDISSLRLIIGTHILREHVLDRLISKSSLSNRRMIVDILYPHIENDIEKLKRYTGILKDAGFDPKFPQIEHIKQIKEEKARIIAQIARSRHDEKQAEQVILRTRGHVYIAINPHFPNLIKIGYTTRDLVQRMKELSAGTGTPGEYISIYSQIVDNPQEIERKMHQHFANKRLQKDREFFQVDPTTAINILLKLI